MGSRRSFLGSIAAAFASRSRWVPSVSDSPLEWHLIGEDAWMVQGGGGNTTVLLEIGGAVVIDLKLGGVGATLEKEIVERIGPIQAVIVTHHHGDHATGFHAFRRLAGYVHGAAADRIRLDTARASGQARDQPEALIDALFADLERDFRYRRSPDTEPAVRAFVEWMANAKPDEQVPRHHVGDRRVLRIGRTTYDLIHPGPAHTDNDLYVYDRRRNLLATGDLLFHRHHPFVDVAAGATTAGWDRALDQMIEAIRPSTIVVSGHGGATDRAALEEQKRYFAALRALVREARKAGKSRAEIEAIPNTAFAEHGFGDLWALNLGTTYDEQVGGG